MNAKEDPKVQNLLAVLRRYLALPLGSVEQLREWQNLVAAHDAFYDD